MEKKEEKRSSSPCYKKKEGAGLVSDMRDHLEQLKSTSAEKHWICLKNTARRAGDYVKQKKQSKSVEKKQQQQMPHRPCNLSS